MWPCSILPLNKTCQHHGPGVVRDFLLFLTQNAGRLGNANITGKTFKFTHSHWGFMMSTFTKRKGIIVMPIESLWKFYFSLFQTFKLMYSQGSHSDTMNLTTLCCNHIWFHPTYLFYEMIQVTMIFYFQSFYSDYSWRQLHCPCKVLLSILVQ